MGLFHHNDDHAKAYDEYSKTEHKAKLSHQVIAGAAGYEIAKAYNDHCAKNGKPNSHAQATQVFAALSSVVIDRLAEKHVPEYFDKQKAKKDAEAYARTHFDGVKFDN